MQIENEYVDQFDTPLSPKLGMSQPVAILASNNKKYYLKREHIIDNNGRAFFENAVFLQELFVSQIANELQIPVPGCAILNLEDNLLKDNRDLAFRYHLTPGIYYGSEILPNVDSNLVPNYKEAVIQGQPPIRRSWNAYFRKVSNTDVYPSIIALDLLTANFDRFSNEGNILVAESGDKRLAYAFDFGHCFFSPFWNNEKINLMQSIPNAQQNYDNYINIIINTYISKRNKQLVPLGTIFNGMQNNIYFEHGNPFNDIMSRINNISPNRLADFLNYIPESWLDSDKQFQFDIYIQFIERSKVMVLHLLDRLYELGAFNNSLGGKLKWKTKGINYGIQ